MIDSSHYITVIMSIITNDLILYFDTNNNKSLIKDLNGDYHLKSIVKWSDSITNNITLNDYGLTAYDIGQTSSLTATTNVFITDNKLELYPTNSNDASGNSQSYLYPYTTAITSPNKVYLNLSGGSFQNYFKLEGFDWQLLPYRYNKGVTIETWVHISSSTLSRDSNIILYIGTRAENKYSTLYSGDTGYTTSNGLTLGLENTNNVDYEEGVKDNVFSLLLNKELQIGYKYIDLNGKIVENYSKRTLNFGWNHIVLTYKPYTTYISGTKTIENGRNLNTWEELIDCAEKRSGNLSIFKNGLMVLDDSKFPEQFWYKSLNTEKEKQIGVPYNLVWGGGSFGLKNSYHYSQGTNYEKDTNKQNLIIEENFSDSFFGGISVLRIYDKPFSGNEIRHNYNEESNSFGLNPLKGGRIIYTN